MGDSDFLTMTPARLRGLPTPSNRKLSANAGPTACNISLSVDVFSSATRFCQPLITMPSNVRRHHSILDAYDVGLDCFCRMKSAYRDFRREMDVDWYEERVDRRLDEGPAEDMMDAEEKTCAEKAEYGLSQASIINGLHQTRVNRDHEMQWNARRVGVKLVYTVYFTRSSKGSSILK